jgi:hypothetical protein
MVWQSVKSRYVMLTNSEQISPSIIPGLSMSKFLKNTHEQIERFQTVKNYPKKLLSFRSELSAIGVKCSFQMYTVLSCRITSPIDGFEIQCAIKEFNSLDVILVSSSLPYSIVFEDCGTGIELAARMKAARLLSYPARIKEDNTNYVHGGVSLNELPL